MIIGCKLDYYIIYILLSKVATKGMGDCKKKKININNNRINK